MMAEESGKSPKPRRWLSTGIGLLIVLLAVGVPTAWAGLPEPQQARLISNAMIAVITAFVKLRVASGDELGDRGAAYLDRCRLDKDMGDCDRAIDDLSEAIRQNPNDPEALFNRGRAFHAKKDYQSAIADYDKAVRLNPTAADLVFIRGHARLMIGDLKGGNDDVANAQALDAERFGPELCMMVIATDWATANNGSTDVFVQAVRDQLKLASATVEQLDAAYIDTVADDLVRKHGPSVGDANIANFRKTKACH